MLFSDQETSTYVFCYVLILIPCGISNRSIFFFFCNFCLCYLVLSASLLALTLKIKGLILNRTCQ